VGHWVVRERTPEKSLEREGSAESNTKKHVPQSKDPEEDATGCRGGEISPGSRTSPSMGVFSGKTVPRFLFDHTYQRATPPTEGEKKTGRGEPKTTKQTGGGGGGGGRTTRGRVDQRLSSYEGGKKKEKSQTKTRKECCSREQDRQADHKKKKVNSGPGNPFKTGKKGTSEGYQRHK